MEYSVQLNGQMIASPRSGRSGDMAEGEKEFSSLSKLKGLSKDDKTENAMLRSRIDEQSQLIMILKNRSDETINKIQTLERINEELTSFRDSAKEQIEHERRKFNLLDGRFNDLASNHEEMIKFKDEYKRVNAELRKENDRLRDENAKLFSKALLEKDEMIHNLEGKLITAKEQCAAIDTKYRREAAAVNSNRAVRKLKDELDEAETKKTEVTKEFEAYKKHTTALLKKEKELNERLRHLCG
ncbi:CCD89-like protein [Mya arenaria]|uniref:CCD89-like protein n=1 Tax=Mya arenaria TaxID=6604 RepID=A0ABY7D9T5_MYAAR|nr:CCD89-like protein [Mya arenaria]